MQTIGERLEEARKKKGVSIREAAEATKIRGDYLQKFESNHFDIGLTEIYTRGFLRTYANFLKVPADRVINDYAALGRGDVRPRQPSREVYGRMDISGATAGESGDRTAPEEGDPAAEAAPVRSQQPHYPRSGGASLPTGPDPAMIFRYVKWGGVAVIVIIALFVLKLLFSGSPSSSTARTPASATVQTGPSLKLVATNAVHVTVEKRNPDGTRSEVLFDRTLSRGETATVPRNGEIFITATAAENLILEINGRQYPMAEQPRLGPGYQTARIDAPPPQP